MPEYGCGRTEGPAGWRGRQLGGLPRYGEGRAGRVAALLLRGGGSRGGVAPGAEGVGVRGVVREQGAEHSGKLVTGGMLLLLLLLLTEPSLWWPARK